MNNWNVTFQSCNEKEKVLKIEFNQIINLTQDVTQYPATHSSGCKLQNFTNEEGKEETWYNCSHYRKFQSGRERWWFIALDNCMSTKVSISINIFYFHLIDVFYFLFIILIS